ncbi:ABC transporter substrate-binding protein [Xanthobacter flavus]|uniref:ABC transporter substrate-binding protein n=1 Tax=Xanthobacter flavus TaxID=281 RepID=UPI00372A482D
MRNAALMRLSLYLVAATVCSPALAQLSNDTVKIGIMADMSGPYADQQGPGDVVAAKLAIRDFGGTVLGRPVELVSGDMQNKPDVGLTLARRWFDTEHVDAIIGIGSSSVGIALQGLAKEKNKITIATSVATSELTGKECGPTSFHWVYDTYALAKATASAMQKQGARKWFFLTTDSAFGYSLEKEASKIIVAGGGTVVGSVKIPINSTDFSSYLLKAQSSGADIVALSVAGADAVNAAKQAREFGLVGNGQKVAGLILDVTNVYAIGLPEAQGMLFSAAFYWDQNAETRAFSDRFRALHGRPPTMMQAGVYSATIAYLKAVKEAGTDDAQAVQRALRALPVNDFMTKNGYVREDGRMMRDMYLLEVKKPDGSNDPWDLATVISTIPAEQAFRPLSESECPMINH